MGAGAGESAYSVSAFYQLLNEKCWLTSEGNNSQSNNKS